MKKIAIILSLVLLVSAMLVGCQNKEQTTGDTAASDTTADSANNIIGTWTLTGAESDGQSMDSDMIEATYGEMKMEFKADGVVTTSSVSGSLDAEYVETENSVSISVGGIEAMVFTKSSSELIYEDESRGEKLIFTK